MMFTCININYPSRWINFSHLALIIKYNFKCNIVNIIKSCFNNFFPQEIYLLPLNHFSNLSKEMNNVLTEEVGTVWYVCQVYYAGEVWVSPNQNSYEMPYLWKNWILFLLKQLTESIQDTLFIKMYFSDVVQTNK